MTRWVLKPVELVRAAKRLGLKHPVSIKTFSNAYWAGEYDPFPLHVVWINRNIKRNWNEDPSWTIWHELGHALQCERDFGSDGDRYELAVGQLYADLINEDGRPIYTHVKDRDEWYDRYESIPLEREADEIAEKYSDKYPLVKVVRVPG